MPTEYFKGHGSVYLSDRNAAGNPEGGFAELLEISTLEVSLEVERLEHMSKSNRIASKDVSVVYGVSGNGNLVIDEHDADTMALALYGTNNAVAGGSVGPADFDDTAIGDNEIHRLPSNMSHLSALSIEDSAGTPVALVLDTDYEIVGSLDSGLIKFLATTATFTQPFSVLSATEDAGTAVGFLTDVTAEKFLVFRGINVAESDSDIVLDLYRCDFSPSDAINLLNDDAAPHTYSLNFEILKDSTKSASATFGQYGRYRLGQV